MGIEVRVPTLPESVSDATLITWHKKAGDPVKREETLVDIETDKVVFEVPAPDNGVLAEVRRDNGATVGSNEVIAIIEPSAALTADVKAASEPPRQPENVVAMASAAARVPPPTEAVTGLSPAVRHLVSEHQLDPAAIAATGKDGRLTKADVLHYLDAQAEQVPHVVPPESPEPAPEIPAAPVIGVTADQGVGVRRVPMSRLRMRVAERLLESQQTTAALTTFNEVNMQAVFDLRKRYRDPFEARHGVKLGLMSFFVRASVEALRRFPLLNASLEDNDILYHDFYNIGIAVASPRGLVVPTLRNADTLGFAEIERLIADFSDRAREGKLAIEELSGGTFTISNGGVYGSLLSTPILNPPQSGILGMHKIEQRPVAEAGEVRIRPMMYLALTYDHRIIDGKDAVQFLVAIKEVLEDPARLLLDI
jgi:2-oxoglutarate dehydrogenase E2 component (dihydrolipoamide succinyltransferase)